MRSQKLLSVFLLLLFFVPGVLFALSGGWQTLTLPSAASIWDGTAAQWTENILAESFAGKDFLCSAAAALQTALGRNQQNGCGDCAAKNPQLGAGIPVQSKAVYPALLQLPLLLPHYRRI